MVRRVKCEKCKKPILEAALVLDEGKDMVFYHLDCHPTSEIFYCLKADDKKAVKV